MTMPDSSPISEVRGRVADVAREAKPAARSWVEKLARAGYAAKGVQYGTSGLLAALAAVGAGSGRTTDSKGVIRELYGQPYGQALVALMAFGLAGYALWRFVEAILDPEHDAQGFKGILKRVGRFANGVLHVGLVVFAIGLLSGAAFGTGADGGQEAKSWSARLMSWPGGVWVVGAAGVGFVGFAVKEMFTAWTCKLDDHLDLGRAPSRARRWAVQLSRFGIASRAGVFALVGVFLLVAAIRTDPNSAKGLGEALGEVRAWSFGGALLAVIAAGLIAYGAYQTFEARYRRIQAV
jgi:hypothetical protein